MIELPKSTEFNKRIPKQKFYENINVSSALKKAFVSQIKVIYWRNKIAVSTTNLGSGNNVREIEVFELKLNLQVIDESLLLQIDREIPYHILFLCEYQGMYQAWICYKQCAISGKNAFKVNKYYHTDWMPITDLPLKLKGLDLDVVYENYVRQVAGDRLQLQTNAESLKESVNKDEQRQALKRKIDALKNKIKREKQLNKQMQINAELKKLKRELEDL